MSDPVPVQQQRALLNRLAGAAAQHDQAIAAAKAAFEQEEAAIQAATVQARTQADARFAEVNGVMQEAKQALTNGQQGGLIQRFPITAHPYDGLASQAGSVLQDLTASLRTQLNAVRAKASTSIGPGCGEWIGIALLLLFGFGIFSGSAGATLFGLLTSTVAGVWIILAFRRTHPYQAFADTASMALAAYAAVNQGLVEQARLRMQAAGATRQQAVTQALQTFLAAAQGLRPLFDAFSARCAERAPAWEDPAWSHWQPSTDQRLTAPISLGTLRAGPEGAELSLPALLPFPGGKSLVIRAGGNDRQVALGMIQSAMLRLLASVPPGQLHFTFIDPMGLGSSAAAFMHLADYDEQLVNSRSWNEPQQIERQLQDLSEHMQMMKEKYLRTQYESMVDYNEQAGEVAEPYRVLVVFGFPGNFSDTAARRLASIAATGPSRGVYTIVLMDPAVALPHGFTFNELAQGSAVLMPKQEGGWSWIQDGYEFVTLTPVAAPDLVLYDQQPERNPFSRVLTAIGARSKDARRVEVPFEKLFDLFREQRRKLPQEYPGIKDAVSLDPATWWGADPAPGIIAPIGRAGATGVQSLDLGRGTNIHTLIAGRVGSGKSTLLHAAITSLSLLYSPEDLELYLIDFKEGVEFKVYATHQLPHARVIAVQSEREFGIHTIAWCDTRANLDRTIERRAMREFDMRVVFQMSAEDSSQLIDAPAANRLRAHQALLFSEERGTLEKFRPYGLLGEELLARAAGRLQARLRMEPAGDD